MTTTQHQTTHVKQRPQQTLTNNKQQPTSNERHTRNNQQPNNNTQHTINNRQQGTPKQLTTKKTQNN